jgi:hypothetical protein
MEKLLADLVNWDSEKEETHKKILIAKEVAMKAANASHVKALEAHAAAKAEHAEKKRKAEEARAAADDDGDNVDGAEAIGDTPMTPEAANKPEEPADVKVDGESDDDYEEIVIKEKVKAFIAANDEGTRIPEELINEAVRWRLNRNDCQNRGYVLDGYPKSYHHAEEVFLSTEKAVKKEAAEGGEEDAEGDGAGEDGGEKKPQLIKNIYPESLISISATQLFLKRRCKHFV